MKTKILLLFFLFPATQLAVAQIMFQRHYGGTENDGGSSVLQTTDGGYIVVGTTESYGAGGRDVYLIRTNEYGDTLWTKAYGGTGDDEGYSIKQTIDGGYIIAGYTMSFGAGSGDVYLIKTDSIGDTLWTKAFGGANSDIGFDVIQTNDNGYAVIGETMSFGTGVSAIYIVRTDNNGNELWVKFYEKDESNIGSEIMQTNDNGYLIIGTTFNTSVLNSKDCYIIKTNNVGDTLWTKTYGGSNNDWGSSLAKTHDNNYLIMGATESYGSGGTDILLIKINTNGSEIWSKTIGGLGDESGGNIKLCNDNGFIISCSTSSYGAGGQDFYLVKTNSDGDTLWTKTFGGIGDDWGCFTQQTNDGGYILAGYTKSFGSNYDVYIVKTDLNGIAGFEQLFTSNASCILYPNPSNGIFNININNSFEKSAIIEILDITGSIIFSNECDLTYSNSTQIDMSGYNSGLYFVRIFIGPITLIKRVVII